MKVIMLGAPGAGKGTQAKKIAARYDVPHISTGEIFRANIKEGTDLGKEAKIYIDQGLLVPDDLTIGLAVERLKHPDCYKGYVFDGFPRTIGQAEALDATLEKSSQKVDHAIEVNVPDEKIIRRVSGRRACIHCGNTYHIEYAPPRQKGECNICSGELILRQDDAPETVTRRLNIYHERTRPLITYYSEKGVLSTIDGTKDVQDVYKSIIDILGA